MELKSSLSMLEGLVSAGICQMLPYDLSPTSEWATIAPLVFVLSLTMLKDAIEDYRRYMNDTKVMFSRNPTVQSNPYVSAMRTSPQCGHTCSPFRTMRTPHRSQRNQATLLISRIHARLNRAYRAAFPDRLLVINRSISACAERS